MCVLRSEQPGQLKSGLFCVTSFRTRECLPYHPRHNFWFDEDGRIHVKNLSAFWLPEFTLQKEIGGTVYTVTGSYDGVETLNRKMERIMAETFTEKMEDDQ